MYRVFEALDELVAIVEEARGVPMTSNCVVPRQETLLLLDDVRESIPGELDDAQDVLDQRDKIVGDASSYAQTTVDGANAQAEKALEEARGDADRLLADAKAAADRMVAEATNHSEKLIADARAEADRTITAAQREYEAVIARASAEASRLVEAGNDAYDRSFQEGLAEQRRLVTDTEVVRVSESEAARIVDAAHVESDRLRGECDVYVDSKMAEFEEFLTTTARTVSRGRQHMRQSAGVPEYAMPRREGEEDYPGDGRY